MEVDTTQDIDEVLDYHQEGRAVHDSNVHRSADERMGCKKCKEGQRRRRRQEAEGYGLIYNMRGGIRVANLGHTHLSQTGASYTCPVGPAPTSYDPSLNCMRDARGNAVCSDGLRYPPGCPHTPPDQYFTPGITPDVVNGGILEGQVPAPRSGGSASSSPDGGPSTGTVVAAGAGAIGLGALLLFIFR